jgi:hypothetical protein
MIVAIYARKSTDQTAIADEKSATSRIKHASSPRRPQGSLLPLSVTNDRLSPPEATIA